MRDTLTLWKPYTRICETLGRPALGYVRHLDAHHSDVLYTLTLGNRTLGYAIHSDTWTPSTRMCETLGNHTLGYVRRFGNHTLGYVRRLDAQHLDMRDT